MIKSDYNQNAYKHKLKNSKRKYANFRYLIYNVIITETLLFLLSSCDAVAGIFKAGMSFGIFIVVAIFIAVVYFIARIGKNKTS